MSIEFSFDADRHLYSVQGKPVPSVARCCTQPALGPTTPGFLQRC
jgi:hypothetical protein